MKRTPVVDYREFRLKKLNAPEFRHLTLLFGWLLYFALYFLTENLIPQENCTPVHSVLDDWIPFCEFFVLPYVGWYLLIVVSLLYFALYNVENFKRLQIFIMITQALAMVAYILFPTRQDLRPTEFLRENVLVDLVRLLYVADTNTGVCPSLHCAYSIGIASVWFKERSVGKGVKLFVLVFVILVCLSTMFIKQHSAVDFFAAIPVCIVAEVVACGSYWRGWKKERKRPCR